MIKYTTELKYPTKLEEEAIKIYEIVANILEGSNPKNIVGVALLETNDAVV